MKQLFILLLLMLSLHSSRAQENEIDAIVNKLKAHPEQDADRVDMLIEVSFFNRFTYKEREKFSVEILEISRKIGYARGEGVALVNLGYFKIRQGNKAEGEPIFKEGEAFAKKSGNLEHLALWNYRTGLLTLYDEKTDAIVKLQKAEESFLQLENFQRAADCQQAIADYYQTTVSNYPMAMEYWLRYQHAAEKSNSSRYLLSGWLNLGSLYSLLGDYSNAFTYLEKVKKVVDKGNVGEDQISTMYNGFGETYRLSGNYPEALKAYRETEKYKTNVLNTSINESNLADVYTRIDSLSLAFKHGFYSLKLAESQPNNDFLTPWIHGILARAYAKKGMADSSIFFASKGLDIATSTGTIEYMRDNAEAMSNAYVLKKDYYNAYQFYKQFVNYRDSMLSADIRNKTTMLQYNSDMGKKQAQIAELNQQKKAQKYFLISALIVLTFIIASAILLLRNNRQKQKANTMLLKQKAEIDEKAQQLSIQKESLEQSYNNVELLGEIGRKITSSLSVSKIISTVYNNVNSLMDAAVFGIGIYHDDTKTIDFPATYENGQALPAYSNSIHDQNRFAGLCFISGKEIVISDLTLEYNTYVQHLPTPVEGHQPASLIYLPLMVKEKMFGVITVQSFAKNAFSDYHLYMLRTIAIYAAIALENAEAFKRLNVTVASLQNTQRQLIQSEKMASLGELTAGIAHEIQNPLNFVNNFSEINKELIQEMHEEITKGNFTEVETIAKNIAHNQEKINHHGKRADAIVKGMLQHSQKNTGEKFMSDINMLADEFLRLAYHGLRAKDKSFNSTIKTEFDEAIDKVNVIPQDIGRVLLNLYNNAFYTVNEKRAEARALATGYEPTVTVRTKRSNGNVEIAVADNGNGIPQHIVDKIFQPFFTTKPTGQGTGLGLSLSYDIVKAHGGELKVETTDGKGTTFFVQLPYNLQS